ncbi:MAG: hypothetical protein RLZ33_730 [Bacteroidota bacterium]|jgi:ribosomal protein S18 acetylase RimI-like enzyme
MNTSEKDKRAVIDILCQSFKENKSVNFVVKQDHRKERRLRTLMAYSYYQGSRNGKVYLNEDKTACAIILYSTKKKTSLLDIYWDLKLVLKCIGLMRIFKVLKRESFIKQNHPTFAFVHLWYIGVLPGLQGKGIGGNLMNEILNEASKNNLPIYLETSTERNFKFYESLGFSLKNAFTDLGYKLHIYIK